METVIIIKALLSAWGILGLEPFISKLSQPTLSSSLFLGVNYIFFYSSFDGSQPYFNVSVRYTDPDNQERIEKSYMTHDIKRALKKAYMYKAFIESLSKR